MGHTVTLWDPFPSQMGIQSHLPTWYRPATGKGFCISFITDILFTESSRQRLAHGSSRPHAGTESRDWSGDARLSRLGRAALQGKQMEGPRHKRVWWEWVSSPIPAHRGRGQGRTMGSFTIMKTQSCSLELAFVRCLHGLCAALCMVPVIFTQNYEL